MKEKRIKFTQMLNTKKDNSIYLWFQEDTDNLLGKVTFVKGYMIIESLVNNTDELVSYVKALEAVPTRISLGTDTFQEKK